MRSSNARWDKTLSFYRTISVSLILLLLIIPTTAFSKDSESIDTLRQMGKAFADIAEKASPAVVGIKAKQVVSREYSVSPDGPFGPFDPFEDDFFDYFFRRHWPRERRQQRRQYVPVQGSGFIISPDGYILTNNHMVEDMEEVTVMLVDKREFAAEIIGTDPDSEVAVIKINTDNLSYLELADSDTLEVGEWVLAIGNPFGLNHTVTAGIVSAKGRSGLSFGGRGPEYQDFIQTDAAINLGNSGGPLINLDGKVVGINTAIISRTGGSIGIGLAVPINMAKNIYEQLVEGGTVVRGFLGIQMTELTPELAEAFGLEDTKGVAIADVVEDSAAEKAGLKHNDVIIEFEGKPVDSANELRNRVAMLKPGTKVEMVVLRDGKRKKITAELGERSKQAALVSSRSEALEKLGITVKNLTDELAGRLGYEDMSGVVVTEVKPGSEADTKGVSEGLLIVEVNRKPVKNIKDFEEAVEKAVEDGAILLLVNNGRYNLFIALNVPAD